MASNISILQSNFDCVVMLTFSDWKTEPRSNRYHYATRFAQQIPVVFVQADVYEPTAYFEKTQIQRLEILHVYRIFGSKQTALLNEALLEHNFIKPLLWIYNPDFSDFIIHRYSPLRIYHASEDYFASEHERDAGFIKRLRQVLCVTDLLVAVSRLVLESYLRNSEFRNRSIVLRNGCDYRFWAPDSEEISKLGSQRERRKVAFFQGGVNRRIDYDLLRKVCERLPDWEFWICGKVDPYSRKVLRSLHCSNLKYFGYLEPHQVRQLSYNATVGIIPFVQNNMIWVSLPLKAFEYIACGLPVVSVPIGALQDFDQLFALASTAEEFAAAIVRLAPERHDFDAIEAKLKSAQREDYDVRFSELVDEMDLLLRNRKGNRVPLNILVLYDIKSVHVSTIKEHLSSFALFSESNVFYAPATNNAEADFPFSGFDVLIIHYSIRLSIPDHLSQFFAKSIQRFGGYKVAFIQDEYDSAETARRWLCSLGIHAIYTCVPEQYVDQIYPVARFPHLRRIPTLTGYVPLCVRDRAMRPISERKTVIGYRGRELPYHYGDLAREKFHIAQQMKDICFQRGIPVDIEWSADKRIYGDEWYAFVENSKATLGTESGSNVFDDYGDIKNNIARALENNPAIPYQEIHDRFIGEREGWIIMNQISPRIFEAIALGTALVLFEGEYSGIIKPGIHYISLKKDFSNIDEVLEKLGDDNYLERLTKKAYRDIILSGKYGYANFVNEVDNFLSASVMHRTSEKILVGAIGIDCSDSQRFDLMLHKRAGDPVANSIILNFPLESPAVSYTVNESPLNPIVFKDILSLAKIWLRRNAYARILQISLHFQRYQIFRQLVAVSYRRSSALREWLNILRHDG